MFKRLKTFLTRFGPLDVALDNFFILPIFKYLFFRPLFLFTTLSRWNVSTQPSVTQITSSASFWSAGYQFNSSRRVDKRAEERGGGMRSVANFCPGPLYALYQCKRGKWLWNGVKSDDNDRKRLPVKAEWYKGPSKWKEGPIDRRLKLHSRLIGHCVGVRWPINTSRSNLQGTH